MSTRLFTAAALFNRGGGGSSPRTSAQRRDLSVLVPRRVVPVSDDCGRCAKGTKTQEV